MDEIDTDFVKITKREYDMCIRLKKTFRDLTSKAQAANNLNILLQEKEQELKWYKEKEIQNEAENDRLQRRISSMMNSLSIQTKSKQSSDTRSFSVGCMPLESTSSSVFDKPSNEDDPPIHVPGVSKTMFDNVCRENLKIKRLLQDALQKDGKDLKKFLVSIKYDFVVQCYKLT